MLLTGVEEFFHDQFVRGYDRVMRPFERIAFADARARLAARLSGRILDLGAGTGANFPYYSTAASLVVAVDPESRMLERALPRARSAGVPVALAVADGHELPFADATFDGAIATLVFCTIPDPRRALDELRRVIVPDGRLLMLEHVRSQARPLAWMQDIATPVHRIVAGGCHLNRTTVETVAASGFRIVRMSEQFAGSIVEIDALRAA